jgi:hypothetical protein
MSDSSTLEVIDHETRTSKLVHHLGTLVHAGGEIEEQQRFMAIVVRKLRPNFIPNLVMAALGLILFFVLGGAFFLLACAVALLGAHLKITAKPILKRILVRVDETGRVVERELPSGA